MLALKLRRDQLDALARRISDLISPPLLLILLVWAVAQRASSNVSEAIGWAILYLLLADVLPIVSVRWLARRGMLADVERARGRERLKPLAISLSWVGVAFALFQILGAPPLLRTLLQTQLAQGLVMAAITPFWQISFHGGAVAALAMVVAVLYGEKTWPLALLLVPVTWSQVRLGRHTTAQVLVGALVTAALYKWLFWPCASF